MVFGRGSGFGKYRFTDGCRRVLSTARDEARRLGHADVSTEHLLLALLRDSNTLGAHVLKEMGADAAHMRDEVEVLAKRPGADLAPGGKRGGGELPYSARAKKVIELAMWETEALDHQYVGTEHLLLALAGEERGIAAQVLRRHGIALAAAREAVLRELGRERSSSFRIEINDRSDASIYEQIIAQVQEAVATGRIRPGDRLPTVRQLADDLDIAPGTVARAYGELERRGVVITEGARGTRVAPRPDPSVSDADRPAMLADLLRPVVVAAFHLGASATEIREALEQAMRGIFGGDHRGAT